jgi:hypothetical protein
MSETKTEALGRRGFLTGGMATVAGGVTALAAAPAAQAGPHARLPMDTPIEQMIYAEDVEKLTDAARQLTKADLMEMAKQSRGDAKVDHKGLTDADMDSVEEAFYMRDVRNHAELDMSSLLPDDGLVTTAHAGGAACCCCCAVAGATPGGTAGRIA